MPIIFLYLIKLSVSLAVMYLFYQIVLRRLTFYNHNRWYLVGYSLLCFFIPLLNISPVLQRNEVVNTGIVAFIPTVETFTAKVSPDAGLTEALGGWTIWSWLMAILVVGTTILLLRLVIQFLSFLEIKNKARLIANEDIKFYQVNKNIIPFSFGNSIFINQHLHTEAELKEIIRHEFVHVKQRHTLDIICAEVLCLLNWYNPFAWLIKKAIRQNLEFIADNKVVENGMDKKQYQYLLLKVVGNNHFSIASNFNFSSLKKRVVMMNKMKTARVHLIKFLFVLPLLAVLLLAFRNKLDQKSTDNIFWFAGLTLDAKTGEPLRGVDIHEKTSGLKTVSDQKGFFKIAIPATTPETKVSASFALAGYTINPVYTKMLPGDKPAANIDFIYMRNVNDAESGELRYGSHSELYKGEPDYAAVLKRFNKHKESIIQQKRINEIVGDSEKPIWIVDGIPYAIGNGSKAWFDKDEVNDSHEFRVWVDGKVMTMEEANRTIDRFKVLGVGASPRANSFSEYGINYNLLMLNLISGKGDWTKVDTIPDVAKANSKGFFIDIKDNKGNCMVVVKDKNQKEVKRLLLTEWNEKEKYYEELFGKIVPASENCDIPAAKAMPVQPAQPSQLSQPSQPAQPVQPLQPSSPKSPVQLKNITLADDSNKPLIIVDGVEWPGGVDVNILDANKIEEVSVWKNGVATNKYGDKGKNGVVVITTKKQADANPQTNRIRIKERIPGDVLYYLNGKPITKEGFNLLDPDKIKSINVLKGNPAEQKYGEKGKNGVIEITIPTSSKINFIEQPITPAWDFENSLPGKKKDKC